MNGISTFNLSLGKCLKLRKIQPLNPRELMKIVLIDLSREDLIKKKTYQKPFYTVNFFKSGN